MRNSPNIKECRNSGYCRGKAIKPRKQVTTWMTKFTYLKNFPSKYKDDSSKKGLVFQQAVSLPPKLIYGEIHSGFPEFTSILKFNE